MNRIKSLISVFAFSLLVLTLPSIASAQWGGNNRGRNDNGRNNGYYNTGQLESTVKRLKNDSRDFERFVKRELDNNRNNRNNSNNLKRLVEDFKKAADRLENRFKRDDIYRANNEARNVINLSNQLDRQLRSYRLGWDIENYWRNIGRQVDEIQRAYNMGNNNRGNNNRGGWRDNFPF